MAVEMDRDFHGVKIDGAYVKVQDNSIVGGKSGYRCIFEIYRSADLAKIVEVARTPEEIPNHMRHDPVTGAQLTSAQLQDFAEALPKARVRNGEPYTTIPFPAQGVIPRVPGEDPLDTLYKAFMEENPGSKKV